MATVIEPGTVYRDPLRHGTRAPLGRVHPGEELYLVEGPLVFEERQFWQVHPAPYHPETNELGWVAATKGDGERALIPLQLECPPTEQPLTSTQLDVLGPAAALSCYGRSELTLQGSLRCSNWPVDAVIGGPFLDGERRCNLDQLVSVFGAPVATLAGDEPSFEDVLIGEFTVRGHFDDPDSLHCGRIPLGSPPQGSWPSDPLSVMQCRSTFVATDVELTSSN